jgi:hypothetical protein
MKTEFGTLKGIPVYEVRRFDPEIARKGCIQLIDDETQFWKICTTSSVADGVYDIMTGNTSIYDNEIFNMNLKALERMAYCKVEPTPMRKEEKNLTEECVNCLLPELDSIIDNIMGSVNATCEDLMSRVETVG